MFFALFALFADFNAISKVILILNLPTLIGSILGVPWCDLRSTIYEVRIGIYELGFTNWDLRIGIYDFRVMSDDKFTIPRKTKQIHMTDCK